MYKKIKKLIPSLLFTSSFLAIQNSYAAINAVKYGDQNNAYVFIENNIDHEYFITSKYLDPRFSGSNIWSKYAAGQVSLGYMGLHLAASYNNVDMWLENSRIDTPFQGIRCMSQGANCPSTGFLPPEMMDKTGMYKARSGGSVYDGNYAFASFAQNAYQYFNQLAVGSTDTFQFHYCRTTEDYNPLKGERCINANAGFWGYANFNVTKIAHIKLSRTNAASEIWVATDGTPSLSPGAEECYETVVANVAGISCKMVNYTLQNSETLPAAISLKMNVNATSLGFTPAATELKISGDGSAWYNYSTATYASYIFKPEQTGLYIFFSKPFFQKLVKNGGNIQSKDGTFTFNFASGVSPESGYYEFTAATQLDILPREYNISIKPIGDSANQQHGTIGSDQNIEFNYKVMLSAPRMADLVTAQVLGESAQIKGKNYCVFKDNTQLQVAIPSYLSFTKANGTTQESANGCGDSAMTMTNALWEEVPWDVNNSGYFYSTQLKLWFPMNDPISEKSTDGRYWQGTVSAEGDVEVKAKWIGVDQ
jgi:Mat/Ecp fimbriae adhesin